MLAPVPARLKEWAYAGFAINLASALIAHLSVGDGPEAWGWAAATGVLWGLSYFFWRRLQANVRVYHGSLADLPRRYVALERLCLKGHHRLLGCRE